MNLAIALTLTAFIFVAPHFMFHRMLERAKEKVLAGVYEKRRALRSYTQSSKGDTQDVDDVSRMLDLIYLTQYEGVLGNQGTWLVDLEVVMELRGGLTSRNFYGNTKYPNTPLTSARESVDIL